MTYEDIVLQIQNGVDVTSNLEKLYQAEKWLLKRYAKKYADRNDFEDLMQQGYIGLQHATQCWEPDGGASFTFYAAKSIANHIIRYKLECEKAIRLPAYLWLRLSHFNKAYMEYRDEHGIEPSDSYMMKALNLSQDQVNEIKRVKNIMTVCSLDAPANDEDDAIDVADEDDCISNLLDDIERQELKRIIWEIVDSLPGTEPKVLHLRFEDNKTLSDCASTLGVSAERIRVVEKNGLRHIRNTKSRELRPYLHDVILSQGLKQTGLSSYKNNGFVSSVELTAMKLEKYMNH